MKQMCTNWTNIHMYVIEMAQVLCRMSATLLISQSGLRKKKKKCMLLKRKKKPASAWLQETGLYPVK